MKKIFYIIIFFLILINIIFFLTGCDKKDNTSVQNSAENKDVSKLSTENNTINVQDSISSKEISSFSTQIFSKDSGRQHNISLTCSRLSGTIVKDSETFSFCNTLGPCTKENGYKEADSFDSDGDTIKLYGGGNCQVSSTLYNALVTIPGIEIIERNDHSKPVPYVPKGKDAAVAYGSVDFRFKNNTGYDIKLILQNSDENVIAKIEKLFN